MEAGLECYLHIYLVGVFMGAHMHAVACAHVCKQGGWVKVFFLSCFLPYLLRQDPSQDLSVRLV